MGLAPDRHILLKNWRNTMKPKHAAITTSMVIVSLTTNSLQLTLVFREILDCLPANLCVQAYKKISLSHINNFKFVSCISLMLIFKVISIPVKTRKLKSAVTCHHSPASNYFDI